MTRDEYIEMAGKADAMERVNMRVRIQELERALQALLDEQNGPPLLRDAAAWEAAVRRAQDVLRRSTT